MNERDSEAVAALLRARGYALVEDEALADIVLLNTCSVRDLAEQKAMGKAAHLAKRKRRNPRFIVGILGCMAQNRGANLLDRLPDLDLVVGTQKFHRVPDHLDNLLATIRGEGPCPATLVGPRRRGGFAKRNPWAHERGRRTASLGLRLHHARVQHALHVLHCAENPRVGTLAATRRNRA